MGRTRRLKIVGEEAYYHLISRTVGGEFYIGNTEKEKLFSIIKAFSNLYFVKVIGFCILDNHFHLLVKSETGDDISDEELLKKLCKFYNKSEDFIKFNLVHYRSKLADISDYMKSVKLTFTRWYNKVNDRRGYLWGDRFKSVLVESGEALMNTLAYIDLNPIRAGVVEKPEDYRWSSIGYRIQSGNKGGFLTFEGIFDEESTDTIRLYRELVYRAGGIEKENAGKISEEMIEMEMANNFKLPKSEIFKYRVRYFSDGTVIGSKTFIKEAYNRFGNTIIKKKDRNAYKTGFNESVYSLRCLKT